ncbi:hypothetical protein [Aneurinibacillus terranovensis]|uniref:hypothetical protein n=1 Tax=Aneurinibacillus terranovensis TaxID=278991 RepID=UPI000404E4E2|nr:hypothetical protein [Aneurinibacillus terranovensis]
MKVRTMPIFLSILISSIVLFGGWYVFQSQFVKKPIATEIAAMKGVKLGAISVGRDSVDVKVTFTNPDTFADQYKAIQRLVAEKTNGKPATIQLNSPDNRLQQIWNKNAFAIDEALDLHTYSKIPAVLNSMKKTYGLTAASSQIDDQNIYVYLNDGKNPYFTVLPRYKEVSRNG